PFARETGRGAHRPRLRRIGRGRRPRALSPRVLALDPREARDTVADDAARPRALEADRDRALADPRARERRMVPRRMARPSRAMARQRLRPWRGDRAAP